MRIILNGCFGAMCRVIAQKAKDQGIEVAAGVDRIAEAAVFPTFTDIQDCDVPADVIIDFSHFSALEGVLNYAIEKKLGVVVATTGLDDSHAAMIAKASEKIAVFKTANFSLGVALMKKLAGSAARFLGGDYDVEIVETHHRLKRDAPSGTALAIADAVNGALPQKRELIFGRHGMDAKRGEEIGIHAVRGGSVVGEHSALFFGQDEVVEIRHGALSKSVFAAGALRAAQYISTKEKGLYSMDELIEEQVGD